MSKEGGNVYLWAHGTCFVALAAWACGFLIQFPYTWTNGNFARVWFTIASGLGLVGCVVGFSSEHSKIPFVLYLLFFLATFWLLLLPVSH